MHRRLLRAGSVSGYAVTGGRRVEWRWLLMGPGIGYVAGLVAGAAFGLFFPTLLLVTVPIGLVVSGPIGAVAGLLTAAPMVFLVGPDLPRAVAEKRAALLGGLVSPVSLLVVLTCLPVPAWADLGFGLPHTALEVYPYLVAAGLGAVMADRAVRLDMPRDRVS